MYFVGVLVGVLLAVACMDVDADGVAVHAVVRPVRGMGDMGAYLSFCWRAIRTRIVWAVEICRGCFVTHMYGQCCRAGIRLSRGPLSLETGIGCCGVPCCCLSHMFSTHNFRIVYLVSAEVFNHIIFLLSSLTFYYISPAIRDEI